MACEVILIGSQPSSLISSKMKPSYLLISRQMSVHIAPLFPSICCSLYLEYPSDLLFSSSIIILPSYQGLPEILIFLPRPPHWFLSERSASPLESFFPLWADGIWVNELLKGGKSKMWEKKELIFGSFLCTCYFLLLECVILQVGGEVFQYYISQSP